MSRADELQRRRPRVDGDAPPEARPVEAADDRPESKTRRKADMHALQDLGTALVELDTRRFDALAAEVALPDRLADAVREARTITAWGGRKRQMQYIGKLMRDVDPVPIRRCLDGWAQGHALDAARARSLERWRDRLLSEADALNALAAEYPRLDRPRLRALVERARAERDRGGPPHAFRELYRALKDLAGIGG
jgi:ribosome-associated protein